MRIIPVLILAAYARLTLASEPAQPAPIIKTEPTQRQFTLFPIGRIEKRAERTCIRLDPRHQPGLLGLDQWSHVWVVYWFDRNDTPEKRSVLRVHPRGNRENPLTGVFATRSPMRPNLLGLSLCKVRSIKDNVIEIEDIDAFDQTPVIDIKSFAPGMDSPQGNLNTPAWAR